MANTTTNLRVIFGDGTLGVAGPACHYIFSYERGGLESLVQHGKEWLYRTPMPTFWRATTDNDRGNGFSQDSAMWLGADLFSHCVAVAINVDDQDLGCQLRQKRTGLAITSGRKRFKLLLRTRRPPSQKQTLR